ncbi:hypothetical protein HELRODRAFT_174918 [Helobdella robusta]|uniref:Uncharacterized protein n=1 Tax=Helobdella robusta TaxID=6412 RepID=T1F8M1_HELRO|nr:hypothetical protein HELRODRAFT_174918 [Helobdella robusta]ESO01363.1 hypothetical protein HELRODRAFT_174918 [Helobdella robusta]
MKQKSLIRKDIKKNPGPESSIHNEEVVEPQPQVLQHKTTTTTSTLDFKDSIQHQQQHQQQQQQQCCEDNSDDDLDAIANISQNQLSITSPSNSDTVLLVTSPQHTSRSQYSSNVGMQHNLPGKQLKEMETQNSSIPCLPYTIFSTNEAENCWSNRFQNNRLTEQQLISSYNQQPERQTQIEHLNSMQDSRASPHGNIGDSGAQSPRKHILESNNWSQENSGDGEKIKNKLKTEKNDESNALKSFPSQRENSPNMQGQVRNHLVAANPESQYYQTQQFSIPFSYCSFPEAKPQQHHKSLPLGQSVYQTLPAYPPSSVFMQYSSQQNLAQYSPIVLQDHHTLPSFQLHGTDQTPSVPSLLPTTSFPTIPPLIQQTTALPDSTLMFDGFQKNLKTNGETFCGVLQQQTAEFFPTIYVSPCGIIEVLLRNHVAVEMTVDRAIRVVNSAHKSVVATNSRGNASCIFHYAAKIYQDHTTFEILAYGNRQAKARTEYIVFGGSFSTMAAGYCVTSGGHMSLVAKPSFSDITKDMSRSLLFSSRHGAELVPQCMQIVESARYRMQRNGATTIHINSIRIHQTSTADVIVTSERKNLRVSPLTGLARVMTHFVDMTVDPDWTIKVKRGGHRLNASLSSFILANDLVEFGFDSQQRLFIQPVRIQKETLIMNEKQRTRKADNADKKHPTSTTSSATQQPDCTRNEQADVEKIQRDQVFLDPQTLSIQSANSYWSKNSEQSLNSKVIYQSPQMMDLRSPAWAQSGEL